MAGNFAVTMARALAVAALAAWPGPASAAGEGAVPAPGNAPVTQDPAGGAEMRFDKALVIEGKVEKPQVQFTLLKEPPPPVEIKFETSFREDILDHRRENTYDADQKDVLGK